MKLIPPKPVINLYEDGFDGIDLLDRAGKGKQLSDIVERIEDPLVIAVDGPWGSGKSTFLKCWVGEHAKKDEHSARTVFFDAFAHDFLNDPLLCLIEAIADRFDEGKNGSVAITKLKHAAIKFWRPGARIGLALSTAGLSEVVGALGNVAIDAAGKEATEQINKLWQEEVSKKAAMKSFQSALIDLTDPEKNEGIQQKLVIVIDELDRCRPDYALAVLEVIKHFFTVPHVHFVLGVNLEELANSVKVRYGNETDTSLYLQKFVSLYMRLPNRIGANGQKHPVVLEYFKKQAQEMGLNNVLTSRVQDYLKREQVIRHLSLRTVDRLLIEMALIPQSDPKFEKYFEGWKQVIAGLVVIKILAPKLYSNAIIGALNIMDVREFFGLQFPIEDDTPHADQLLNQVWASFLAPDQTDDNQRWNGLFGSHGLDQPDAAFQNIIEDLLEGIDLV